MSIAQSALSYYDSNDFKDNYVFSLIESFNSDEKHITDRIFDLFNSSNYETQKYLSNWRTITRQEAKQIYDLINEDIEPFMDDFKSYYVGSTSLDSVSFGEQCEQLTGIRNHKTGKDYLLKTMQKQFDKEGFHVNGDYAYYDLSSHGLHIDLLKGKELINEFLAN
jgi:hypothetical protein